MGVAYPLSALLDTLLESLGHEPTSLCELGDPMGSPCCLTPPYFVTYATLAGAQCHLRYPSGAQLGTPPITPPLAVPWHMQLQCTSQPLRCICSLYAQSLITVLA